ncbi:C40 family peptidase [Gordonia zhaorongruii]|uniref:C40 family peptidase n=1 Tax=Gordonia zhaorongruii TaxID=2597659 RepID=UPI001046306B|nr:C40 family peptidase [Gordonia zhaorongruii]
MSATVLIAPLKMLIATLGTGTLPPGAMSGLRQAPSTLGAAADRSATTIRIAADGWRGDGGDAAATKARRLTEADSAVGAGGADVARVVETAAEHVRTAHVALNGLVDSFVAAAATVPAVTTPAGLAALVPVALDHIARGVQVVQRAQGELARDTTALESRQTASDVPSEASATAAPVGFGGAGTRVVLPDGTVVQAPNERAARAVRAALSVQGTPYVWGGTTTDGFDCSGFTQWAYRQAGVELPRLAQDQDLASVPVSQSDLQPGDLAVWSGHVAMYVGNDQFVETGGDPVGVTPLRTTNAGQSFEGFYRPR